MNRFIFIALVSLMILSSCEMEPTFTEAQPSAKSSEKSFKKKFRGDYLCLQDSSILTIDKHTIIQNWDLPFAVSKVEVDSTEGMSFDGSYLLSDELEGSVKASIVGDSLIGSLKHAKTIFQIGDRSTLKYFNGVYFLNDRKLSGGYGVEVLKLKSNGELTIGKLNGVEDLDKIKKMTPVEEELDDHGEVVAYRLSPSKKELAVLLDSDVFRTGKSFQKIR